MNAESLHEFTELANHLNFTETARLLNISQPTLSKHIIQLEKELKLTLFERMGNSVALTKTGAALLPYAYQISDAQAEFNAKVVELRKSAPPRLTLSGLTDERPSTEMLGFLISLVGEKYGVECIEIKSRYNKDPKEMLDAKEVDIIFDPVPVADPRKDEKFDYLLVANLPLVAIMSNNHPLAQRSIIKLADLRGATLLKYEGVYLARSWHYIEDMCLASGFTPKTRSRHCATIAELFTQCADLHSSIVLIGCNFKDRLPLGIRRFCTAVPIEDDIAKVPFYFLFRKDNKNPVLWDVIEQIQAMPDIPLTFS
ncbi:MAG: LysR family transcriptional regulator [Eggerthellaceae bacterium]|nr:LysR family transcriptional regulator [Eggerthellaceae bacterium]